MGAARARGFFPSTPRDRPPPPPPAAPYLSRSPRVMSAFGEIVLRRRHDAQDSGRSHKLHYVKSRREPHRGASQDDVFSSLFRVLSPGPTCSSASLGINRTRMPASLNMIST